MQNDGASEMSIQTVVVVNIQDKNDNAPMFEKSQYSLTVDEGLTGSVYVKDLIVRDRDEVSTYVSCWFKYKIGCFTLRPFFSQIMELYV